MTLCACTFSKESASRIYLVIKLEISENAKKGNHLTKRQYVQTTTKTSSTATFTTTTTTVLQLLVKAIC